jgi:CIC family chloride channel protein
MAGEMTERPRTGAGESRLLRDFRRKHERRRRLLPRALLVGVAAGTLASLFRFLLERIEDLRRAAVTGLHGEAGAAWLGPVLFATAGALLTGSAVWLTRRFAPEASGSGIPHLKAVLHRLRPMRWQRILPVKFAGGLAGIGAGLALGREGPTVQMGAALGRMISRWLPGSPHERQVLITAGAGAGLAAAFNAPLAGVVFVLEEVQRQFAPGVLSSAFVASVTADVVARLLLGQLPVFHVPSPATPPLAALPGFLLLGALAGLAGVAFNRGLLATLSVGDRLRPRARALAVAFVGAAAGLVAWRAPDLAGGGGRLVESALAGNAVVAALLVAFGIRFALTLASYGTGAPGGIFAPLLVLGAQGGLAAGLGVAALGVSGGEPRAYAIVGMAALFAATVRAPLTGIVLLVEMTESYSLMLPLLAASFVAQWVADLARDRPIYEALLERELARGGATEGQDEGLFLELDVLPGAPFDGRRVAALGLPPGCLLTLIERRGRRLVPRAATELETGDRLHFLVDGEALHALAELRRGAGLEESSEA